MQCLSITSDHPPVPIMACCTADREVDKTSVGHWIEITGFDDNFRGEGPSRTRSCKKLCLSHKSFKFNKVPKRHVRTCKGPVRTCKKHVKDM